MNHPMSKACRQTQTAGSLKLHFHVEKFFCNQLMARDRFTPGHTLLCVLLSHLECCLHQTHTLQGHTNAGLVHQLQHGIKALTVFTQKPGFCAIEFQFTGGRGFEAKFMFNLCDMNVALAIVITQAQKQAKIVQADSALGIFSQD